MFNLAQKSNTILFFDEADSIFGKRSEVNEAKDRYANTEVSYILQRIEQYYGIVILASNYKKNIDEAFLRRMRYLVEFPMPDVATREEIWKSCFTEQVPVDFLDFAYLAKNFELSGQTWAQVLDYARAGKLEEKDLFHRPTFGGAVKKGDNAGRILDSGMFTREEISENNGLGINAFLLGIGNVIEQSKTVRVHDQTTGQTVR